MEIMLIVFFMTMTSFSTSFTVWQADTGRFCEKEMHIKKIDYRIYSEERLKYIDWGQCHPYNIEEQINSPPEVFCQNGANVYSTLHSSESFLHSALFHGSFSQLKVLLNHDAGDREPCINIAWLSFAITDLFHHSPFPLRQWK
jgi:hypothetical protein